MRVIVQNNDQIKCSEPGVSLTFVCRWVERMIWVFLVPEDVRWYVNGWSVQLVIVEIVTTYMFMCIHFRAD